MTDEELRKQFSEEFFEEHMYKPLFRSVFLALEQGESTYRLIEQLCVIADNNRESIQKLVENNPMRIIVSTERMEELKKGNI